MSSATGLIMEGQGALSWLYRIINNDAVRSCLDFEVGARSSLMLVCDYLSLRDTWMYKLISGKTYIWCIYKDCLAEAWSASIGGMFGCRADCSTVKGNKDICGGTKTCAYIEIKILKMYIDSPKQLQICPKQTNKIHRSCLHAGLHRTWW